MRFNLDCIPCLTRQAISTLRMLNTEEELQEKAMRLILQEMQQLDFNNSPPYMSCLLHRIIKEQTGIADPYKEIKKEFNQAALNLYDYLEKIVQDSQNPFEQAIRFAASANIIDFGILFDITIEQVKKVLQDSINSPIKGNTASELEEAIKKARKILYLGDNTGEIVMDKLLLTRMPREKVTYVVKGKPIINDALMEDVKFVGITDLVRVIDNGADIPGTVIELSSKEFQQEFADADLIIAKGQGNYECLNDYQGKKKFFIFRVKCTAVAKLVNCEIDDIVLKMHE